MAIMFDYLKKPLDYTKYNLMYGVTDWGRLNQFNLYESGYSFLYVVDSPEFMKRLGDKYTEMQQVLDNYIHILQFEFKGLDGLEDITTDPLTISDGIDEMNVIGKVKQQSQATLSMRFLEKSGSVITRFHELFLTGIKDPRTQIKRYHGLIGPQLKQRRDQSGQYVKDSGMEPGYENEVFTLLYMVTDNTGLFLEKAFLLLNAQPGKADMSIYESEKGNIETKEINVEMNCFPITSNGINKSASELLQWMNTDSSGKYKFNWNSNNFNYYHTDDILAKLNATQRTAGMTS